MGDPDRIEELESRLAQLENQVQFLTDKLGTAQAPADQMKAILEQARSPEVVQVLGTPGLQ